MNEPRSTRDLLGYLSAFSRQGAVAQPVAGAIGQHLEGAPEVAEAAAIALGKIGGEQARQLLLSALGTASPELAPVLQENLLVTGVDPASAQALVEGGANPAVRAGAYRLLLESDPARAKSLLSAILDDPEFTGRDAILRLAVTAGSGEMAAELLENLDELREQDQPIILGGISDTGRAEFEPRMAQLYQTSENAAVKSVALECLSAIASKDSLPLLLEVYETQGGRSQELAAQAISTVEAPEFDQQLLREAAAGEPAQRVRAIRLLGLRNPAGTTEFINTILAGQAEGEVLRAALEITQIIANLDTLRILIDLVHANQDNSTLQKDVLLQLKRATLRAASPAEAWNAVFEPALQNASSDEARRSLIMILDCAASEGTLDYLKNTAASDNALLRQAAVRNLMRWQEFRLGPVVIDLAANPALSEAESKLMWQKAQQVLTSRDIERPNFQNELDFAITLLQSSAPLEVKEQIIEHYQEGIGKPREKRQFKEQMTEAELPAEVRQRITPLLESIKS
jgi:HEAT repeat protein